jgi:uncharacterized protein (TIGR04255 family)
MKKYNDPPIIEALCAFLFAPDKEYPYDDTVPGTFYNEIKEEFPIKRQINALNVTVPLMHPESQREQPHKIQMASVMQFFTKDNSPIIQINPNILTINITKPYLGWEYFKPLIIKNFNIYKKITRPKGLNRIDLRYINKFSFDGLIELDDYFNYHPSIPKELPQNLETFQINAVIPSSEINRLVLNFNSIIEKPGVSSVLLDLSYFMSIPERVSFDQLDGWLEDAHKKIETAFESCITDKCRETFGGIK